MVVVFLLLPGQISLFKFRPGVGKFHCCACLSSVALQLVVSNCFHRMAFEFCPLSVFVCMLGFAHVFGKFFIPSGKALFTALQINPSGISFVKTDRHYREAEVTPS